MNDLAPNPAPAAAPPPAAPTSTLAVVSLIFGILSWVLLPLLGPIVSIITGHLARGEIRRAQGQLSGDALAVIGLVLGYAQLALVIIGIAFLFLVFGGIAALAAFAG